MKGTLPLIVALLGLFLGSGGVGVWLAKTLAPGSFVAEAVSLFALPVAFALGLQAWYGFAIVGAVWRLIRLGSRRAAARAARGPSLPGGFVFLPISSTIGATAGLIVGLLSPTQSALLVAAIYWFAGTLHGFLAWRLARAGVLVPPESI